MFVQSGLLKNIIIFNMNKIQLVFLLLAIKKMSVIISAVWQRSSVVEQRNHNPLVGGPNPSAATKDSTPIFIRGLIFGIVVDDEDSRGRGVSW